MIAIDEHALICDLAETYNIYNYRQMPPIQVAIFACGLSPDSRIMRKITGMKLPTSETLLAGIVDRVSMLLWMFSKDGQKNRNRPHLILDALNQKEKDIQSFSSGEEFKKAREELIKAVGNGN